MNELRDLISDLDFPKPNEIRDFNLQSLSNFESKGLDQILDKIISKLNLDGYIFYRDRMDRDLLNDSKFMHLMNNITSKFQLIIRRKI